MATTDELRRALQQRYGEKPVTILGTIAAVDETAKTCDIDDDGLMMYGIRLQSVTNAAAGILKVPKKGAAALAVKIEDGDGFMLLDCAEYDKIIINGGGNGGLINIESLVDKINAVEKQVEAIKDIFANQWTATYESALKTLFTTATTTGALSETLNTSASDIEDTTVTH